MHRKCPLPEQSVTTADLHKVMSELLDYCLKEVNKYEEVVRVDSIPKVGRSYADNWKLSTEIGVGDVRHDIDLYIGFPIEFPYSRPDFYFQSLEFGYLPHAESKNGKLCLDEDGSAFSIDNPVGIILESLRKAKILIKEGVAKTNVADYHDEIESYWTREYNDEPDTIDNIIFYGEWPSKDCEVNELSYRVVLPEDAKKNFVTNVLLYTGDVEPFNGYISEYFQHSNSQALFLSDVSIRETAPYNLSFEDFLNLLSKDGRKRTRNFLNRNNGGEIYFKLTDNRIAGVSFEKTNPHKNGFRVLKPCSVYENFGNKDKNLQRLYGYVYTKKRAAERTAGTLAAAMNFLVVGLGSIGSNLVHFLQGYNNTSFTLVDKDFLTADNIGRHVLGFRYVNLTKVHGMADYIKSTDLETDVRPVPSTLQEYIGTDFNRLNIFTAIFLCIGDVMTERYVYQAVINGKIKVPIFNLWLEPFGVAGHMIYVNPTDNIKTVGIYEEKTYRYVHNLVKSKEYDNHSDMFIRRDAGCNGAYTLYSQNDVLLMLSTFYPIINRLLQEPSHSKCYRWVGNKDFLLRQGIKLNITPDIKSGAIQEFPL